MIDIGVLGQGGVIKDTPKYDSPPNLFTEVIDMDFELEGVTPAVEEEAVFSDMQGIPFLLDFVQGASGALYPVYLTADKAFYINSGIHKEITRNTPDGGYNAIPLFKWNGGFFHGEMVWTDGVDVPQAWNPATPEVPLVNLPNWPENLRVRLIRPFLNFLVGLGYNNGTGFFDSQTVIWSDVADPGTLPPNWDITDPASRAGAFSLTSTSDGILEAEVLGNELFIYKADSVWSMRFVGGTQVMSFSPRFSDRGVLASNCVAAYGSNHFVVGKTGIYLHNGASTKDLGLGLINDFFYADLNGEALHNCFVIHEEAKNRIWIFYPALGSDYANKALIWSYRTNTWTFRNVQQAICGTKGKMNSYGTSGTWDSYGSTWADDVGKWSTDSFVWSTNSTWDSLPTSLIWDEVLASGTQRTIHYCSFVNSDSLVYDPDLNQSTDGLISYPGSNPFAPIWYIPKEGARRQGYAERTNLCVIEKDSSGAFTVDRTVYKHLTELYPEVLNDDVEFRVGTQAFPDGPVDWSEWVVFSPDVDIKLDPNVTEKFLAIAFRGTKSLTGPWVLSGYSLNLQKQGRY